MIPLENKCQDDCSYLCYTVTDMLSLDFIRLHSDVVREGLRRRGDAQDIDEILRLIEQRRGLVTRCDGLYAELKPLREQVRTVPEERREALNKQNKAKSHDIRQLEVQCSDIDIHLQPLALALPNIPHASVPSGESEDDDCELRRWGTPLSFHFVPQKHWDLSERLHLTDLEAGAKLSVSRFIVLKGHGARLERALITFMLDLHTREHGYTEIMPPFLVRRACMVGTSQLPKFEPDMYGLENGELFLAPTAEVPLTNLHREEILSPVDLPKKFVAYTPCFRREAGSAGREPRGILRVHQFDKVELVKITPPEKSYEELESLLADAEKVLQLLGLHYRVIELCTGDLGFGSAKTYDIEVWSAGQNGYLEVSSCSNFEDFQARRMNLRYKDAEGKNRFCHTLNGSGLALPRLFAALIENCQQPDGSIRIPEKLQGYFGAAKIE